MTFHRSWKGGKPGAATGKGLSPAARREVKRIVQKTEPQEWTSLFSTGACNAVPVHPGTCPLRAEISIAAPDSGSADVGEKVLHRTTGGIWFVPTYPSETTCAQDLASERTHVLRWALWSKQTNSAGSMPPPHLFDAVDWAQYVFVRKGEHCFGGNSVATLSQPLLGSLSASLPSWQYTDLASAPQTAAAICAAHEETLVTARHSGTACGPLNIQTTSMCSYITRPMEPWLWSAPRHIPKGYRVRDDHRLSLLIEVSVPHAGSIPKDLTFFGDVCALVSGTSTV